MHTDKIVGQPSVVIRVYPWLLFASFVGCETAVELQPAVPVWSLSGPTMGTRYAVSIVGGEEAAAERLKGAIDKRLALLNRRMSTYDAESELSRFNTSESDDWFDVSKETAIVTAYALALANDTKGAYDPTVGPLVNLWGFGPEGRGRIPSEESLAAASEAVGHTKVEARITPPALRKDAPDVALDLSSVAKGYGVDAVCQVLDEAGVSAFMVEIGGEVRTKGTKPGGSPWRIGVEKADEPLRSANGGKRLQRVVELTDRALATSGDYRNYFEQDGVRYSHTIDPRTGRPVTHRLATVTVLADNCMTADAQATALLVLGPEAGYDWAKERQVAALFVTRSADGVLTERATPVWDQITETAATP